MIVLLVFAVMGLGLSLGFLVCLVMLYGVGGVFIVFGFELKYALWMMRIV